MIPRCAASATWNPHVDVKGREDAVDVKGLEDDATETTHGSVDGVEVEGYTATTPSLLHPPAP